MAGLGDEGASVLGVVVLYDRVVGAMVVGARVLKPVWRWLVQREPTC